MSRLAFCVALTVLWWAALHPRRWPWRVALLGCAPAGRSPAKASNSRRPARHPDGVPDCADLLAVAIAAGTPTSGALSEVGAQEHLPRAIQEASASLQRGNTLDDVLAELGAHGADWHSLSTVLSLADRSGPGSSDAVRRFATSERLRLRRERERRARRLPVLLLLPLTTMVLPAFALVTVVPFLVLGDNPLELPPPAPVVSADQQEGP